MTATSAERRPALLTKLLDQLGGTGRERSVLSVRSSPPSLGDLRPLPPDLDIRLAMALAESSGIRRLYSHQVSAWEAASRGHDVVVVTPTASGKSLCFNLPVLDRALKYPPSRSLYLYPTKALANDQLAALEQLLGHLHQAPTVAVFHGDLSQPERLAIRANPPNILLATPDILHYQQLPKNAEWADWWRSLHFVVLDEAHAASRRAPQCRRERSVTPTPSVGSDANAVSDQRIGEWHSLVVPNSRAGCCARREAEALVCVEVSGRSSGRGLRAVPYWCHAHPRRLARDPNRAWRGRRLTRPIQSAREPRLDDGTATRHSPVPKVPQPGSIGEGSDVH